MTSLYIEPDHSPNTSATVKRFSLKPSNTSPLSLSRSTRSIWLLSPVLRLGRSLTAVVIPPLRFVSSRFSDHFFGIFRLCALFIRGGSVCLMSIRCCNLFLLSFFIICNDLWAYRGWSVFWSRRFRTYDLCLFLS